MTIPLIILGNGRQACILRTIGSIHDHLKGFASLTIVDDSGDAEYRRWLEREFLAEVVPVADERAGYWRAMRTVWQVAAGCAQIMFWEDDFVLNEPVDAAEMLDVLDAHPYLTQIALLRQPWFGNERAHGGLIEALEVQGQRFEEQADGRHHWIEHRACFTGNPSLLPERTLRQPWPDGDWSESRFGQRLFREKAARGAYWGRRSDPPRVTHIGHERAGHDY